MFQPGGKRSREDNRKQDQTRTCAQSGVKIEHCSKCLFNKFSALGLVGLMSKAMMAAVGTNSRSNSSRFGPSSTFKLLTPVRLPPGRFKLVTRPSCTGSKPVSNTIGIVLVATLAATASALFAAITVTWRRTRSAANAGSRSYWPSAQRYWAGCLTPSTSPTAVDDAASGRD